MTKTEAHKIMDDLSARLPDLLPGFKLILGAGTIVGESVTFNLEVCRVTPEGTVLTGAGAAFRIGARHYGLDADDLGKTFTFKRRVYTITGLRPQARAYPIQAARDDGKVFNFSAATVKAALRLLNEAP